ncbi:MAG: RNA polymerase sigma factor [Bacteroidota bacterium]
MDKNLENTFLDALEASQDKLFRICSSYAKDADDAKDLFQEVLVNIWKAMPSFNGNSALDTWMYRITLNVSLRHRANLIREKNRRGQIKSFTIEYLGHDGEHDQNLKKLNVLRNCVRMLNDADKAIVTLYLEELAYKEISEITGLKENTIAVRIKRIKEKLLHCLNDKL